jgi:hypothetical protein
VDGDLGLELGDAPTGRGQVGVLAAGPAGQLPGVDQMLTAPDIDRLLADGQVGGDLSYRPSSDQVAVDVAHGPLDPQASAGQVDVTHRQPGGLPNRSPQYAST